MDLFRLAGLQPTLFFTLIVIPENSEFSRNCDIQTHHFSGILFPRWIFPPQMLNMKVLCPLLWIRSSWKFYECSSSFFIPRILHVHPPGRVLLWYSTHSSYERHSKYHILRIASFTFSTGKIGINAPGFFNLRQECEHYLGTQTAPRLWNTCFKILSCKNVGKELIFILFLRDHYARYLLSSFEIIRDHVHNKIMNGTLDEFKMAAVCLLRWWWVWWS